MTSEAHKRNPPGSERWGVKTQVTAITTGEAELIEADGLGGPKLFVELHEKDLPRIFADAIELEKWRAARADSQAGEAQ